LKIQLLEKIKTIKNLNMLPAVVSKLLQITSNPKSSVQDVAKIVKNDFTLSANILKIVNSPFYGFPRKIVTVNDALVILGYTDIRNIALSLTVFDKLGYTKLININEFWRHSLGVAITSKMLAEIIKYPKPDEAFICGQLHDIGKLILSEYFPEMFKKIIDLANNEKLFIIEAEEKILDGINHAQIGSWICEKWKLPPLITRTVAMHHSPMIAGKFDELSTIVNAADFIIKDSEIGFSGDCKLPEVDADVFEFLNISDEKIDLIYNDVKLKINQAEVFLNMIKNT